MSHADIRARAIVDIATRPFRSSHGVLLAGALMITAQLAYRAWALYGGYFLIDDFGFLAKAVTSDLDSDFLFTPYGDHLQPLGFLIVWIVGHSEPYDWVLASSITLVIQAMASTACFAFLVRLAGRTWRVLIPLGFYLFAVVTLPGFMWWAAAIVQVPLQLAAFLALTAHLEHLRTRQTRWIAMTSAALLLGMMCDVKIVFVGIAMLFMSLYLNDGHGVRGRVQDVLAQWRAWVSYGLLFVGYVGVYLNLNPAGDRGLVAPGAIFDTMVRFVLGPLFLGGPWRWGSVGDAPLPAPAPPEWAVTLTWVVVATLVVHVVRRRRPASAALVLLLVAVTANTVMVSLARGEIFRGAAALEVRYLGDLAPILVLVVAFVAVPLEPRRPPRHELGATSAPDAVPSSRPRVALIGLAFALVLGGAMVSSTQYVLNWHASYPARTFFENVVAQAEDRQLMLLDQQIPLTVIPRDGPTGFEVPSQVFTPLGDRVVAGMRMNDPEVLDPNGIAYPASVQPRRVSTPGPVEGCGYRVGRTSRSITLGAVPGAEPVGDFWWASIGYLANRDGVATLSFNGVSTDMEVRRGLHDFFFLGSGPADEVTLTSRSDIILCVDNVRVGTLAPLEGVDVP
ncbi:hypothetical protein ACFQW6_05255 [Nocardioides sp. GCM10028917]|uniref:hypothetical protein n=1 Tax=Nocardioides sp. GCM10028917 TaxID=3273408 RepID=UPI00360B90A5